MTITLPPELAKCLELLAKQRGTTPEEEAVEAIRSRVPNLNVYSPAAQQWMAEILAVAKPVSANPLATYSREEIYD